MPEDVYGYPDYTREDAIADAHYECDRLRNLAVEAFPGDWDCVDDDVETLPFGGEDCLVVETIANWPEELDVPPVASVRAYARAVVAYAEALSNLFELET